MTNNKDLANSINEQVNKLTGDESLGFKRYMVLPAHLSSSLQVAHYLADKPDNTFTSTVREFLGSMSEHEYKVWLQVNLK